MVFELTVKGHTTLRRMEISVRTRNQRTIPKEGILELDKIKELT
jgi:hypothetical protein